MRSILMTTTAMVACATASGAWAQVQTPATKLQSSANTASAQTASPTGLADIIVTAQRKSESSQRAAVAINVVGGSDLTGAGVTQIGTLSTLVPALSIQQIGPSNASFIRGVGNFSVSVTSDPAVAFNYDGVYLGRLNGSSGTFFDLDRIEVLKGPQGTLYGRNATAGVINVIPTQPKLGQFSGYGTLSYGNYHALTGEGAINIPLGPNGALRASATVTDRNGYLNDGTSDDKTHAVRLQGKANLTPALTIRLSGDYTHLGGVGQGITYINNHVYNATTGQFVVTPTNFSRSEGFLSAVSQAFYRRQPNLVAGRTRDNFPQLYQNSAFYGTNAQIDYDTGAGVLTIIPAIRFDTIRNLNPAGGFPIANVQKDIQYSVEARFAGKVSLFDYQVGAFFYDENVRLNSGTVTFGANLNLAAPTRQNVQSYAPFARLTAHITPRLRVVGGIRYTHDDKRLSAVGITIRESCTVGLTCPTAILPVAVPYAAQLPFAIPTASGQTIAGPTPGSLLTRTDIAFNQKLSFGKATYRGAAEFDLAPASLLYASVETGFRSGGFNTSVGFETFQPEYITAYTVGSKNRFLNNRVQLNVEGFYWKYRNQQIAHPGVDAIGRAGSITENIGRSTIKGFEVEGRVLITPTTTFSTDVQYLDAKDKVFAYSVPVAQRPRSNCAITTSARAGFLDINCAGLPSFNSPKWTINVGLEQVVKLGDYKLVLGGDTQYKSGRYLGFEYQPEQYQNRTWTTNGQASFGPADGHWSISGYIRNIENKRRLAAPFAFGNVLVAYTTAPRTYGARGSFKF